MCGTCRVVTGAAVVVDACQAPVRARASLHQFQSLAHHGSAVSYWIMRQSGASRRAGARRGGGNDGRILATFNSHHADRMLSFVRYQCDRRKWVSLCAEKNACHYSSDILTNNGCHVQGRESEEHTPVTLVRPPRSMQQRRANTPLYAAVTGQATAPIPLMPPKVSPRSM